MAQDPWKIARAKVSAHTFAEIFNSFIEPISYKAMLFTAMMIFGCFAVSNFAFGVLRNKGRDFWRWSARFLRKILAYNLSLRFERTFARE